MNNAGFATYGTVRDTSMDEFDRIMSVNLRAALMLTKLCLPHLGKVKGSIVNNSSVASLKSYARIPYYNMSKVRSFNCLRGVKVQLG